MNSSTNKFDAYLPHVDRNTAGLLRFSAYLLAALKEQGTEVELFVAQLAEQPEWVSAFRTRFLFGPRWLRFRAMRSVARVARVGWLQCVYPLSRWLRAQDATLLLLAHESAPFPWWPQLAVVHDLTALRPYSGRGGLLRLLHHRCWVLGLRRSRWIISVSDATRDDLIAHYPELIGKVITIHEGVDRDVFQERALPSDRAVRVAHRLDRPYLLYAGTLAPHKNVELLIPVLEQLVQRDQPDLVLVIVGKHTPEERSGLLRLAHAHGIDDRLVFPGYVPDGELAALMRDCAAFVFPSLNEGFGLAPVEAMSCGAPVVAAAAGSLPEVLGDGAVLLSPTELQPWVEALLRVLNDSDCRQSLCSAGIARAKELSWESTASAVLRCVQRARRAASIESGISS